MSLIKGFILCVLLAINDKRGILWQWILPDGHQITISIRKKGAILGKHRHKGEDPSKRPELGCVVWGWVKLTTRTPDGQIHEQAVRAGMTMAINSGIDHKVEVMSRRAILLEYRITRYDPKNPDTESAEL